MEPEAQERAAVAKFFAKRFPTDDDRHDLARAAGVQVLSTPSTSAVSGWERMITEAQSRGKLGRLARAAAKTDPEDLNLQRAAALLARGDSFVWPWAVAGGAVAIPAAAVALVAGVAWLAGAFEPSAAVAASTVPVSDEIVAVADADEPLEDEVVQADEGIAEEPADVIEEPADEGVEDEVVAEPVAVATTVAPDRAVTASPANHHGRCTQAGGGLVGYWWAGEESPGHMGDVISVPRDLNVRAWAPSVSNGFDTRGDVRCTLGAGDRIRLSAEPLDVPGGAVWVPLNSGDLVVE